MYKTLLAIFSLLVASHAVAEDIPTTATLRINNAVVSADFELTDQPSFSEAPPQRFIHVEQCSESMALAPLLEEGQVCLGYVIGDHERKYLVLRNEETTLYARAHSRSVDRSIVYSTMIHVGFIVAPHPERTRYDVENVLKLEVNTPR